MADKLTNEQLNLPSLTVVDGEVLVNGSRQSDIPDWVPPAPEEIPHADFNTIMDDLDEVGTASPNVTIQTPNFMPVSGSFEATEMFKRIKKRLPMLDVVQLRPETVAETVINSVKNLVDSDWWSDMLSGNSAKADKIEALKKLVADNNNYGTDKTIGEFVIDKAWWLNDRDAEKTPMTLAIYMLFMTFAASHKHRYRLPIMSSPYLDIKTGAGWEKSSSIFPLITKFGSKTGTETGSATGGLVSMLSYLGQDLAVGPLFSTKGVMETNPTFMSETILINDCKQSAIDNKKILQQLMIGALPGASGLLNIKPGALFNVAVKIGIGESDTPDKVIPMKKLFLCTGDFKVTPHGIYRDGVTPEVYKLTTTFTSLLPDFINMQMLDFENVSNKGNELLGFIPAPARSVTEAEASQPANAG